MTEIRRLRAALAPAQPVAMTDEHDRIVDELLKERDAANDYIDALLDVVLGADRNEWTSNYGHADAMQEVRDRMAAISDPEAQNVPETKGDWWSWHGRLHAPSEAQAAPKVPAAGELTLNQIADLLTGVSVSVDVSTGDSDIGNRLMGTVCEVMEAPGDFRGITLLVQDAEPNFVPEAKAQASAEPPPAHNLPDWDECKARVDSGTATRLHQFIYDYDDADPNGSGWFMYRLEQVIEEAKARAVPDQQIRDALYQGWDDFHPSERTMNPFLLESMVKRVRALVCDLHAPQPPAPSEHPTPPNGYESLTPAYTRFISPERYARLKPDFQKWYRPYWTAPQPQAAQPVADIEALMSLVGQYWDIAHAEGGTGQSMGDKAQRVLDRIRSEATALYTAASALTEEQIDAIQTDAYAEGRKDETEARTLSRDQELEAYRQWVSKTIYRDEKAQGPMWDAWQARAALRSTQGGE